ncbi:MAG: hypothetical protein QM690_14495 [Sphingobium sp.]
MGEAGADAQALGDDGETSLQPTDLQHFIGKGNLEIRCLSCWHGAVFCPSALARWYEINRYDTDIAAATRRLRCRFCLAKTPRLTLVDDPVTAEWLPNNDEQWDFFANRMRWLRRRWVSMRR